MARGKRKNGNGDVSENGENGIENEVLDPVRDPVQLQILALYVVQKLGQGSLDQIVEVFAKEQGGLGLIVSPNRLEIALDALRKRGFLSLNSGALDDGTKIDLFSIKSLKFQSPPEVAHYADVLPRLLHTSEAAAIKGELDDMEHGGEAKEKASRLGYRDYYVARARFKTIDPFLGAMPLSPTLKQLLRESPHRIPGESEVPDEVAADVEGAEGEETKGKKGKKATASCNVYFDRDPSDGALIITADQVGGWLRTNMRVANMGDVSIYIGTTAARIYPAKGALSQMELPVVDARGGGGGGRGLVRYECLAAGAEFEITFKVPSHGFLSPEAFRAFLVQAGINPIRGLSPARGKRYGRVLLLEYTVTKDARDASAAVEAAIASLPESLRKEHAELLKEHLDAAQGVKFVAARGAKAEA